MTLTDAQKTFLADFTRDGYQLPPAGYRGAGPDAARWWRTANILIELGLIVHPRDKHGNRRFEYVVLTWRGLAWTVAILRGEV